MDALELSYPVDAVAAAVKLMGPDGSVRTIEEVELCEADRGSVPPSYSFQHFSSYGSHKAGTSSINDLDSVTLDKIPDGAVSKDGEDASEDFESRNKRSNLSTSSPGVQLRKSLKVSRSSSSSLCSKRPRVVRLEDSLFSSGADDVKDTSEKLGSYLKKCSSHEKTQLLKQKSLSSKRGDKRNLKVSLKTKFDLLSTNTENGSAAAGSNFLGLYGLKSDVHDFTKLTVDPPLNDLLDGSYDCSRLSKDKGKKDTNVNECFLQSIRKACSVLQLPWPARTQNIESESCSNGKPSTSLVSSVSSMEEGVNFDGKGPCATDTPSLNKVQDACNNSETLTDAVDFKLYKPDDMFLKLDLPLPKDLESLLQDASKSTVSSKNATDLRSAKQQSRRAMLQPFTWSHSFNGHSKANSDSSKLSANKTTCPGRWWRVANFPNIPSATADCFTKDLESLTLNQSLFPSTMRAFGPDDGRSSSVSVNHHQCGWDSLSSVTCSKASSVLVESQGRMNHEANEQQCPTVMAAAQTLYDIATYAGLKQNIDGIVRWPKKPSQKSMKARKLKSEETEELYAAPTTYRSWSNNLLKNEGHTHPSKKPKLGTIENKKDIAQTNCKKGALHWATPRSSRTSPSKFVRDSVSEGKQSSTSGVVKQSSIMMPPPPPATTHLCKAGEGQQKTRKLMLMDWKRGGT